jgi:hypothetical protein
MAQNYARAGDGETVRYQTCWFQSSEIDRTTLPRRDLIHVPPAILLRVDYFERRAERVVARRTIAKKQDRAAEDGSVRARLRERANDDPGHWRVA